MVLIKTNPDGSTEGIDPRKVPIVELGSYEKGVMKAIRAKCLDCSVGSEDEVRKCVAIKCSLWPFRMGKSPWTSAKFKQIHKERNES